MTVYHGSVSEISHPDVSYSKRFLDFGRGFYVTSYKNQAEKWALRKGMRSRKTAIVNVYELLEDLDKYKVLKFENENEKWLDFVCECRKGSSIYKDYDIIIGGVADDDVFKTIDRYFRGMWDKERALDELRYYKVNNQIAIINQSIMEDILIFKGSFVVGGQVYDE